jgi:hypothetical protein
MAIVEAGQRRSLVPDVIHVGLRKTGTTYLQKNVLPLFADRAVYVKNMQQLAQLGDAEARPIILSNEGLTHRRGSLLDVDPQFCENVAELNPRAHIIVSIRSQFSVLRSMFGLAVKMGYADPYARFIDDVIASGSLDYLRIVTRFRERFGADRVTVLLFEELIGDPDAAIRRVAASLGVDAPASQPDANPVRETPGDLFIEVGRLSNRLLGPRPTGWRQAMRFVAQVSAHKIDRGKPWLIDTKPHYDKLRAAFADANDRLFQTLGPRGPSQYYRAYPTASPAQAVAHDTQRQDIGVA